MKISIVIPTMNRAEDLKTALDSIVAQSYRPAQIIVVDQSTGPESRQLVEEYRQDRAHQGIEFCYIFQSEKSTAKARNNGQTFATGDVVSFLDDDIVLFKDYLQQVSRHFKSDPGLGALSGNVVVNKKLSGFKWAVRKALMRLFLISDFKGRMTASGFGYPIYEREIETMTAVEFMPGCNMNVRRSLLQEVPFDEWFTGYSFREDSEFSYRLSKITKIVMIPEARLYHNFSPRNRLGAGELKKMEMRNYYYVFKKHKTQNPGAFILFTISMAGVILIDLIQTAMHRKDAQFRRGIGAAIGFILIFLTGGDSKG